MEPRSNAVETPPPPALPNDEARVRFVLKRPDGAKRISTTAPLPVKYAMEDEIVDEALQRGGLRKNKQKPSRFQSLYDFGEDEDPFMLEAQMSLRSPSLSPVGPRSPAKHRYRPRALSMGSPSKSPAPRIKTVSFKDDIIPASNHHFLAKRKQKERAEQTKSSASSATSAVLIPPKPSLVLQTLPSEVPPSTGAVVSDLLVPPTPPPEPLVSDRSPPRAEIPAAANASNNSPGGTGGGGAASTVDDYFFVPSSCPDASEAQLPASDEPPSQ